ncbi:MAG: 2-hydroxychromene-2-carboxylate isomerase, partial [Rhodospirillaceae bacterium]|nr:2-hydroxychromene-2-carboxylate isomerase [Rhodospirillaceae bacterium]
MTMIVDFYYTMRSPYSYLTTPRLTELANTYDLIFNLRPVYPLAVSDPTFFPRTDPQWVAYLSKDTVRTARRLEIPFRWPPRPDPIVQDMTTRKVADEQPYIVRLTRLAQIAAERGRGLEFVTSVSALIFSPDIDGWDKGDHLAKAVARAGLNLAEMDTLIEQDADRLEAAIADNR